MDRFKFRGWDDRKKEKRYLSCQGYMINEAGELCEPYWDSMVVVSKKLRKYLIVEQCAGLKDKNGKLIYESDILLCRDDFADDLLEAKFTVSWCDGKGECLGMPLGWYLQQDDWARWAELQDEKDIEICGNVHEGESK